MMDFTPDQIHAFRHWIQGYPNFYEPIVEEYFRVAGYRGVRKGAFGYVGRADQIRPDQAKEGGGYLARAGQARLGVDLPEEEIDLSAAFIVLPEAIEPETPADVSSPPQPEPAGATSPVSPLPDTTTPQPPTPAGPDAPQTTVRLRMRMTRQQLYASFKAIGNLADQAGTIQVTVEAEKLDGFNPMWLRNGVLEPLDEADVTVEG